MSAPHDVEMCSAPPLRPSRDGKGVGSVLPSTKHPLADARGSDNAQPVQALLAEAARCRASDLILVAGSTPSMFVGGRWQAMNEPPSAMDDLRPDAARLDAWLRDMLTDGQAQRLDEHRDIDFAVELPGLGRYRVNVHFQRGTLAAAFRAIPAKVPPFESLQLPGQLLRFAEFGSGLVLVTGGTGHGKSTTVAAMIDYINRTRAAHVITIEDPIEFSFVGDLSVIEQREVGLDSPTFASALRHVLRQRPDVIVIGEMRDLETISTALTAAETGHLVIASLHTAGAAATLTRVIDVFPPVQQAHVRTQLAASLRAVVCQVLLRDEANDAQTPATEILVATSAVRRALRENEAHLIYSMMETGRAHGMWTFEQSLAELVRSGRVDAGTALQAAPDRARLGRLLGIAADGE